MHDIIQGSRWGFLGLIYKVISVRNSEVIAWSAPLRMGEFGGLTWRGSVADFRQRFAKLEAEQGEDAG
jgi:hypothetical protein